jgi:CheY-like chemotaxis protein
MGGRGTILIVDDDPRMRGLVGTLLDRQGYDTVFAADGKEALELYEKGKFTAILSDYQMPIMDGYEFCKNIRAIDNVPFVMMTASGANDRPRFEHPGVPDDIILKPFDIKDFYQRIESAIEKYKAA